MRIKLKRDLLRDEVIEDLFEENYGREDNERFYRLVDTFTNDRNDDALQNLVLKLYDFSRSHPDPDLWLDKLVDMYNVSDETGMDHLPIMDILKFDIELQLGGAQGLARRGTQISKMPGGPAPRSENYLGDLRLLSRCNKRLGKGGKNFIG